MAGRSALAALVAMLCLLAFSSSTQAQPQYPTVLAAAEALNLTSLVAALETANLTSVFEDPDLQTIVLAPSEAAFANFAAADGASVPVDELKLILSYHVIPVDTPYAIINSTWRTLPTLMQPLLNATEQAQALTTVTVQPATAARNILYVGGIIPGALTDLNVSVTAAKSTIYVLDNVLIPPISYLLTPTLPLTLADAITSNGNLTLLAQLIDADETVKTFLSNNKLQITVFAPTDAAITAAALASGLDLESLGTADLRRLLYNHIIPIRPYTGSQFPLGSTVYATASTNIADDLTVTRTDTAVTVSGTGNTTPATVVLPNIAAGKSVIHIIDDLLLVSDATALPPPAVALPSPSVYGSYPPPYPPSVEQPSVYPPSDASPSIYPPPDFPPSPDSLFPSPDTLSPPSPDTLSPPSPDSDTPLPPPTVDLPPPDYTSPPPDYTSPPPDYTSPPPDGDSPLAPPPAPDSPPSPFPPPSPPDAPFPPPFAPGTIFPPPPPPNAFVLPPSPPSQFNLSATTGAETAHASGALIACTLLAAWMLFLVMA